MAHSTETRAAVMASLLQGQAVNKVAEEYSIPSSTVSRWKKKAVALLEDAPIEGTGEEIGALLLRYVRSGLETVHAQHEVFADADWLRGQDASEAAVLHGVLLDKLVRLLEALDGAPVRPTASSNGTPRNRVRNHV